ncbi:MAG: ROK family protein [Clostridia bacterium]|nr:ROK family protein [Clostridia bacterium]
MTRRSYLGVDIGGTAVKLGIVDSMGKIGKRFRFPLVYDGVTVTPMQAVVAGIRTFLAEEEILPGMLSGIGVSCPGLMDAKNGKMTEEGASNIPGMENVPVCGILTEEFSLPCALANDGNCAVLAEQRIGAARGFADVVGVILGTGIGGGILVDGKILEGSHGFGGEIGHIPLHAGDGEPCPCGQRGCFERYASTGALVRRAEALNPEWKDGMAVFAAAEGGNPQARDLLASWIEEIACGIRSLVHVFDPEIVIIGGGVSAQKELLIDPLRERLLSMLMPPYAARLTLRAAQLGNDAGLIGAVFHLLGREGDPE